MNTKSTKMTQKEFEDRTSVKVPFQEYQAIEKVYMESDLDKDEFCKLWCMMNKTRVRKAKEDIKSKEEERMLKDELIEIMHMMDSKMREIHGDFLLAPLTIDFLSENRQRLLESVGIKLELTYKEVVERGYGLPRFYRIDDTSYAIKKLLKIV